MTKPVMMKYLIDGMAVGHIASDLGTNRSSVRGALKEGGIILRPLLSRDPVCDAVKHAGFSSFHAFVMVRSLDPITEQATSLGVSDKSLVRVYNAYRHLLTSLKTAGLVLPTPQFDGAGLEQRSSEERAS